MFKTAGFISVTTLFTIACMLSCTQLMPGEPEAQTFLAGPLDDLTSAQLALHIEGDERFADVFATTDGLGPIFVQSSCEHCHVGDGKGNILNNLTRFGMYESDGVTWNPLTELGGPQLQHRSITHYDPEIAPSGVAITKFVAPNVTGLGFLEAVEDQTILDLAILQLAEGIVSGVPNYVDAPDFFLPKAHHIPVAGKYIGRFGRKAIAIDLLQQVAGAYREDMGITSDYLLDDPINMSLSVLGGDGVADPEIPASVVDAVTFYIRTLKNPPRREVNDPQVVAGDMLFTQVGCDHCHVETLTTGSSEINTLNKVDFHPYTDMLMHDMGSELDDGYTEGTALSSEWRTMPLWGLGLQSESQGGLIFLMHDGRARTYNEAIQLHGGESEFSRDAYNQLTGREQSQLIKFLESL